MIFLSGQTSLSEVVHRQSQRHRDNPNDWQREHDIPRYIVDLIKRVTRDSLETMKIENAFPALNER